VGWRVTAADKGAPAGRSARRWFLFLLFFHLLPVPWFLVVVAGLAPASFLTAASLASLFNTDSDSFAFAALLLGPALGGMLACTLFAFLVTAGIGLIGSRGIRTAMLVIIATLTCGVALMPIYVSGGHGPTDSFGVLDFITVLGEFNIPATAATSYFAAVAALLGLLLFYQYAPQRFPSLPFGRGQRKQIFRRSLLAGVVLFVASLLWVHRLLIFVYPLASAGFASAQYYLAIELREQSVARGGGGVTARGWLERAAEQGHVEAAMALARTPRSAEDKLRWLTQAAEGGHPEAQYELYRFLMRKTPSPEQMAQALEWLRSAAEDGEAGAQYELGRLYVKGSERPAMQQDLEAARKWWERAAAQEHGRAMEELARRLNRGTDGFPRDPERAAGLLRKVAEGYRQGSHGLPENARMAAGSVQRADAILDLQRRVDAGEPEALATLGRQLLSPSTATSQTKTEGVALLERAAESGDADLLYELGAIFMFGNHGVAKDFDRGRPWWVRAAEQGHVRTMAYLAAAYRNGQYGYPVDLLRAKSLTAELVTAYRDGRPGVDPDPERERYWARELKHFDRLFEQSGGEYLPLDTLRRNADANDPAAQYQLGRQMLLSGAAPERQEGLRWIERAAANGLAEAQYRLVTYYENRARIMRDDPQRGVALLEAAASQDHLPAMGVLALAHYKGNFGLPRDYRQARDWYRKLLEVHATGNYLGEIDDRFLAFQRRQLGYTEKALTIQEEKEARYRQASPLEREIIAIEERYHKQYEKAVNALDRRDGSRAGKQRFREEVKRLRLHYIELREREIDALRGRG